MSKNPTAFSSHKKQVAIQRLMQDLTRIESGNSTAASADLEILSMVVDEAAKGIDILKRYPAFYQKLVGNAALREIFLAALNLAEKDQKGDLIPLPGSTKPNLDFLKDLSTAPVAKTLNDDHSWQISWRQTIQQLQSIFLLPSLAYRSGLDLFEGPWFNLLHTETEIGGIVYSIKLECTPSQGSDAFTVFLTLNSDSAGEQFTHPLQARLQWGKNYDEGILVIKQGRLRLPDIQLIDIFDASQKNIDAELNLTLNVNP